MNKVGKIKNHFFAGLFAVAASFSTLHGQKTPEEPIQSNKSRDIKEVSYAATLARLDTIYYQLSRQTAPMDTIITRLETELLNVEIIANKLYYGDTTSLITDLPKKKREIKLVEKNIIGSLERFNKYFPGEYSNYGQASRSIVKKIRGIREGSLSPLCTTYYYKP